MTKRTLLLPTYLFSLCERGPAGLLFLIVTDHGFKNFPASLGGGSLSVLARGATADNELSLNVRLDMRRSPLPVMAPSPPTMTKSRLLLDRQRCDGTVVADVQDF